MIGKQVGGIDEAAAVVAQVNDDILDACSNERRENIVKIIATLVVMRRADKRGELHVTHWRFTDAPVDSPVLGNRIDGHDVLADGHRERRHIEILNFKFSGVLIQRRIDSFVGIDLRDRAAVDAQHGLPTTETCGECGAVLIRPCEKRMSAPSMSQPKPKPSYLPSPKNCWSACADPTELNRSRGPPAGCCGP